MRIGQRKKYFSYHLIRLMVPLVYVARAIDIYYTTATKHTSPVFAHRIINQDAMINAQLSAHVLKSVVLFLKLFQPLDLRDYHSAVLRAPIVEAWSFSTLTAGRASCGASFLLCSRQTRRVVPRSHTAAMRNASTRSRAMNNPVKPLPFFLTRLHSGY